MKKLNNILLLTALIPTLFTSCGKTSENISDFSESQAEISDTQSAVQTDKSIDLSESITDSETSENNNDVLSNLANSALSVGSWPDMSEVTDKDYISEFFLLDTENENYNDIYITQCPMSANMSELIIIDANDTSSAKEDLEKRLEKVKTTDALYPEDVEKASKAIIGTVKNYAYYILSAEPEKSEEALLMQIEG